MFELFETSIGLSMETGYDWTDTSSETMSEVEQVEAWGTAPPGRILYIEQV